MKFKTRLAQLFACLVIALMGVLFVAAPARATVPYTDENGAAFNCRRVFFDDDGMTWSRFCYRNNGQEFEYHRFWDSDSDLIPTGEDFYVLVGYHALAVQTIAQDIAISDGSAAEYVATNSEGVDIYRIPAGSGDVTITTRGEMQGTFDSSGIFTPSDTTLPKAYPVEIRAGEGFAGFSDSYIVVEDDPAGWVGFPIHVKTNTGTTLYMWENRWASFGFGAKEGYDISNCFFSDTIDMTWGGGVILQIRANGPGKIQITTSDSDIHRSGENYVASTPMTEESLFALKGITFNLNEPDTDKKIEILFKAEPITKQITDSYGFKVYDPTIGTFFGECAFNPQSIYTSEPYASIPLSVAVLSPDTYNQFDAYLILVDKETGSARLVDDASLVTIINSEYLHFDTTIGELINSYIVAIVDSSEPTQTGWVQTPSGAWMYYKDDGTLLTDGWAEYGGKMYYFGSDGLLVWNGVCSYQGKFYYIKNGTRQTTANGWKTEHNRYYYFGNSDGSAYTNKWLSYGGAYYYFGANGTLVFNDWVKYAGKDYYMGSNGKICISTWAQIDGQYVYFNTEGQMVTNFWVAYRGKYYFMDGYGHPYVNTWHTWNGTDYHFDAYGRCDKVGR